MQFVFFVFVMYSSTLSTKAKMNFKNNITDFTIVKYLPQSLFSNAIDNPILLLQCVFIVFVTFLLCFFFLKNRYYNISEKIYSLDIKIKKKKTFSFFNYSAIIKRIFIKNKQEEASYELMKNQIKNSKTLRSRFIPMLFLPLILAVIGVITNIKGILIFSESRGVAENFTADVLILSPSITITLFMCVRIFISNTKIADEHSTEINWIYDTLPVLKKSLLQSGALKYVYFNLLFPLILILFLIISFRFPSQHLLLNLLYITSASVLINTIFLIFDKNLPFSLDNSKINSAKRLAEIFLSVLISIVIFVSQIFIFENVIFAVAAILVLIILSFFLNKRIT